MVYDFPEPETHVADMLMEARNIVFMLFLLFNPREKENIPYNFYKQYAKNAVKQCLQLSKPCLAFVH